MIKAILMDFNGVIINDEPIQLQAYREILKDDGIDLSDEDYYSRLGMDDKTFVSSVLEGAGKEFDADKIATFTRAKTEKWLAIIERNLPLFPGIDDFVKRMSNELSLGIVSMAKREEIGLVLEMAGIAQCFSVIVSAEDVSKCKPDPECYRIGFARIDAHRTGTGHAPLIHSDCLVIEDSPPGVEAARAAGLPVLGVTNTVDEDPLRAAGAASVARDLSDWMPESVRLVFA
jgi:HAD superfamily hydrolase (TIGR01509 family)